MAGIAPGRPAASTGQRPGGHRRAARDGRGRPALHLERTDAVLFGFDGVLTDTASLHQAAWTAVFTELFDRAGAVPGQEPAPFTGEDYRQLADGEPRLDAVRRVLASRHITIPEGTPGDEPGLGSMQAVAAAKDARFAALLASQGPPSFGPVPWRRSAHGHAFTGMSWFPALFCQNGPRRWLSCTHPE